MDEDDLLELHLATANYLLAQHPIIHDVNLVANTLVHADAHKTLEKARERLENAYKTINTPFQKDRGKSTRKF